MHVVLCYYIKHPFFFAMGAASSDFVDPETLPLQILLEEKGKEQNGVDKNDEDNEKLLLENWQLKHEKTCWMNYARQMEKERNNLQDAHDMAFFGCVCLTSPLTCCSEKIFRPDSECTDWKWYKTNCPCCRRPLDITITMSTVKEERRTRPDRGSRHAFVIALWGANAGYALGALVLGSRLQELSPQIDRVIVHTDDVPKNYLEAFEKDSLWNLQQVEYIDGVSDLYFGKGHIFDGVFTKLSVLKLDQYAKVLLLDIYIIPLKPLDHLFDLQCPAAMVRGQGEQIHGTEVDGRLFFGKEDYQDYPWGQSGGINAGIILLEPDDHVFKQMLSEVTCKNHPCHVAGSGPEQDYLSRFYAARKESPWHHISVAWNYQLHQALFAIDRVLEWRAFLQSKGEDFFQEDKYWLPERLRMNLEDIGVVHFSGEVKMWHRIFVVASFSKSEDQRREVIHDLAWDTMNGEDGGNQDASFAEKLMSYQQGYDLWMSKTAEPKDYDHYGCRREDQKILIGNKDITYFLDVMVQRVRAVAVHATEVWRKCYEKIAEPRLLKELQHPCVPEGCFNLGTPVEVSWTMTRGSNETVTWLPAHVLGVHDNKHYVVRFDRGGDWGDTERQVEPERLRERIS